MRRVLFAGTPDFALPSLEALVRHGYDVVGVLTQPDKPQTRKMIMTPPPVKVAAQGYGIPVLQFDKVRKEGVEAIRALQPDVIVTAAYGQIISQEIIDIPRLGVINVHGSLLPAYRGACPIQMAMINGDKETGVTIMRTALKVDSGDIILQRAIPIGEEESLESLFDRLAVLGAYALIEALDKVFDGTAVYTPQDHSKDTFCRMLTREDGHIDFDKTYREINCLVRGVTPWPSAYITLGGKRLKVWAIESADVDLPVGQLADSDQVKGLVVGCKDGAIRLTLVQEEGAKKMSDADYARGHHIAGGTMAQ